ncbi:hypothetical protein [Paracoccus cavernae]
MIGVIVWSSAVKRKAVIWCEDQGPLAYLHGLDNVLGGDEWPVTGAMVALESEVRNELRHAFNVRVLDETQMSELPGMLREVGGTGGGNADLVASGVGPVTGAVAAQSQTIAVQTEVKRPALRVVASQETPQAASGAMRGKQPTLFAVKTAGKSR